MAIDASAKKTNIRLSLKKYLIDTIETVQGKKVFFGIGYALPQIDELTEWFSVGFGPMSRTGFSGFVVDLIAATRKDAEGDNLSELVDIGYAVMTDNTQPDGKRRISLYNVVGTTWTEFDKLLVTDINDSGEMTGPDGTQYQTLTCKINWVAKA